MTEYDVVELHVHAPPFMYCFDERHGSPCPQPCPACIEEDCAPEGVAEGVQCSVCEAVFEIDPRGDVLDSSGRCLECRP
jgi:hypothetical protein